MNEWKKIPECKRIKSHFVVLILIVYIYFPRFYRVTSGHSWQVKKWTNLLALFIDRPKVSTIKVKPYKHFVYFWYTKLYYVR